MNRERNVMTDFSVRSDSVDVEQIMRQIRARIRDKRGVDYTEEQIRELASAKLERFLDPAGVRSGLLAHFRSGEQSPQLYIFEDSTLFDSDKPIVRFIRRLLRPVLKLFFSTNVLTDVLHKQAALNQFLPLYYELLHNLVLETTRSNIELRNLKMRLESVQSRLEFNERRARALEAVVQYRTEPQGRDHRRDARVETHRQHPAPRPQVPASVAAQGPVVPAAEPGTEPQGGVDPLTGGDSLRTRRRRRRRGRRGQGLAGEAGTATSAAAGEPDTDDSAEAETGDPATGPPSTSVSPAEAAGASDREAPPVRAEVAEPQLATEAAAGGRPDIPSPDQPQPSPPGDRAGSPSEPQ